MYRVDIEKKQLHELTPTGFSALGIKERFDIQEWIEKSPQILGEDLMIIGKEMTLPSGKRLDLLGIDKQAALVVVELKRDDSGQSVEWQAIKYASYCSNMSDKEIYTQFSEYADLSNEEAAKNVEEFIEADIEELNKVQRIVLASREFNSEVISAVLWLREFGVNIQCTRLAPYVDSCNQLFIKPEIIIPLPEAKDYIERKERKQRSQTFPRGAWTGYWFVNVGESDHRCWEDNKKFGFIGAGQGKRYSSALRRLSIGDEIYAYAKGLGYVGFGEVATLAMMIRDFIVSESGTRLLDAGLKATRADENSDDEKLSEWVVGVHWKKTFSTDQAKTFSGVFANQNVVCKLRHEDTLRFLEKEFGNEI